MKTLFGLDFVPASTLGFDKRARANASATHSDLIDKVRLSPLIHVTETHWREDANNSSAAAQDVISGHPAEANLSGHTVTCMEIDLAR